MPCSLVPTGGDHCDMCRGGLSSMHDSTSQRKAAQSAQLLQLLQNGMNALPSPRGPPTYSWHRHCTRDRGRVCATASRVHACRNGADFVRSVHAQRCTAGNRRSPKRELGCSGYVHLEGDCGVWHSLCCEVTVRTEPGPVAGCGGCENALQSI